jgi:hypothetical protein
MERWLRYGGAISYDPDEAKEWLVKWNKKGMVHILMTWGSHGGICNVIIRIG